VANIACAFFLYGMFKTERDEVHQIKTNDKVPKQGGEKVAMPSFIFQGISRQNKKKAQINLVKAVSTK
jgi:hypothetical protein